MSNKKLRDKIVNFVLIILCAIVFEMMFFIMALNKFLPTLFFLDIFLVAIVATPLFVFKRKKTNYIYTPIVIFLLCMCFALNTIFYTASGNVFILENLFNLANIFRRTGDHKDKFNYYILIIFIVVYIVFIVVFYVYNIKFGDNNSKKNTKKGDTNRFKYGSYLIIGAIALYSCSLGVTTVVERNNKNVLIDTVSDGSKFITNRIGLLSYYVKNFGQLLFPKQINVDEIVNYFTDSSYIEDEYTGILNNYNVITITIETGGSYMLQKSTTPNLWKVLNEGINCSHNYSKNRTLYSEMLSIVGSNPSFEVNTEKEYKLPFSLPNLLNNEKYQTVYCADIGNNNDCFNQKPLMPNLGFSKCYYHYDLLPGKKEYNYGDDDWERDSVVMESVIDKLNKIEKSAPFYLNYATMCMHARYTDEKCRESLMKPLKEEFYDKLIEFEKTGEWINYLKNDPDPKHENVANLYFNYTLCTMDFDKALGELLDYLDNSGLKDKTLLVLYGDHDIGGYTNPEMSWRIKGHTTQHIDNYSTILGFYNPKLNQIFHEKKLTNEFKKFTSPMVIVPTVLDLLGVKFNPKFYQGKSIFDKSYDNEIFYSLSLQKFMNENYSSVDGVTILDVFNDNKTEDKFLNNCSNFLKQKTYLDMIYKNNLFKKIDYNRLMPKQ